MALFQPLSGIIDHIDRLAPRLTCLKIDFEPYESVKDRDFDAAASRSANLMQNAKELRAFSSSIYIDEQQFRRILQDWAGLALSFVAGSWVF